MKSLKIFLLLISISFASCQDCFEYDTDYDGTNLNNGLEQKTSSASICQKLCKQTAECEIFVWASGDFYGNITPKSK